MLENHRERESRSYSIRPSAAIVAIIILGVGNAAAQNPPLAAPQNTPGYWVNPFPRFVGGLSLSSMESTASGQRPASGPPAVELAGAAASAERNQFRSDGGPRRITLEQVKQQALVNPTASNPLANLAALSIEAAKQHRLGAQADYFPKVSATLANLHFSEFLGQVVSLQHPLTGSTTQVPVPLLNQNQTVMAISFVQPITPLFEVYQLVKIARADERIAMAKAGVTVAASISGAHVEETYFKLLIAQRRLISTKWKLNHNETGPQYASTSIQMVSAPVPEPELVEDRKALVTASSEVKELTAQLNRVMGWPDDTELELVPPDPLVETISLQDVADKPAAVNVDVFEAEQTAVKAGAAVTLSKLAYMPTVAAMAGYVVQNALPLLPNTFGYGGIMVSYNLFDFGKREHAVREATAQLGMAQTAVELTKAKVAATMKSSYEELDRTRQLSQAMQKMGSSVTRLMTVSATPESIDTIAARANVEVEMLEADLAHRQAYARLKALMGPQDK